MLLSIERQRCPKCDGAWLVHNFQAGQWVSQCMGDECDWWGRLPAIEAKEPPEANS